MKGFADLEDDLVRQAKDALDMVDDAEIVNWKKHPCTIYLQKRLMAEQLSYMLNWSDGVFTEDTSSGTTQKNSHALGVLSALNTLATDILDLDSIHKSLIEESSSNV